MTSYTASHFGAWIWRNPERVASALPNPEFHVWPTRAERDRGLAAFLADPMGLRRPLIAVNVHPKAFADIPPRYWQRVAARERGQ